MIVNTKSTGSPLASSRELSEALLHEAIKQGALSWDITIQSTLLMTVESALSCRAGEIALSNLYESDFLKFSHFDVRVSNGAISSARVQLHHEKGHKYVVQRHS
ncbi:hypothetical protein MRB53_042169 [Persea americana]|nr:hypothetical protein MRB53_042169 [Persea americana]